MVKTLKDIDHELLVETIDTLFNEDKKFISNSLKPIAKLALQKYFLNI